MSDPHALPGWTGSSRPRTLRGKEEEEEDATASKQGRGAADWSGVRLLLRLLLLLLLLLLPNPPWLPRCFSKALHGTSPTPSIRSSTTWARGRGREGGVEEEVGSDDDNDASSIFDGIASSSIPLRSTRPFALWLKTKELQSLAHREDQNEKQRARERG